MPEQFDQPFVRLQIGVVGDLMSYEAKPPLLRLSMLEGQATLKLHNDRRMSTTDKGAASDPLKFLFVVLWACRELKQTRINLNELRQVWSKLRGIERIKAALNVPLPGQTDLLADKIRDWAKKINRDIDIRQLQRHLVYGTSAVAFKKNNKQILSKEPFISISSRSGMGAQIEMWFSHLPINELDWDEAMYSLAGGNSK